MKQALPDFSRAEPSHVFEFGDAKNALRDANEVIQKSPTHKIELSQIRVEPQTNPRKIFEGIEALLNSILQVGLLNPVIVKRIQQGEKRSGEQVYRLIAGERRLRAHILGSRKEIDCKLIPSEIDEGLVRIGENSEQNALKDGENARAYLQYFKAAKFESVPIFAETCGLNRQAAYNLLSHAEQLDRILNTLPKRSQKQKAHVRETELLLLPLSSSPFREVQSLKPADQLSLLIKFATESLTVQQLRKLVKTPEKQKKGVDSHASPDLTKWKKFDNLSKPEQKKIQHSISAYGQAIAMLKKSESELELAKVPETYWRSFYKKNQP